MSLDRSPTILRPLAREPLKVNSVGSQDRAAGLDDLVDLSFECLEPVPVCGRVLQRMVVAVDAHVLQHRLVAELDQAGSVGLAAGQRGFELGDAGQQRGRVHRRWRAAPVEAPRSAESVHPVGRPRQPVRAAGASTGSSSTHSCHPVGGSGHDGSGFHPGGGVHPVGGCGQPGGELYRIVNAPGPGRRGWCRPGSGRTATSTARHPGG